MLIVDTRLPPSSRGVTKALIAELVKNGEVAQIKEAMEKSLYPGSQTFEQSLCRLYLDEVITYEEAMAASDSSTNLAWLIVVVFAFLVAPPAAGTAAVAVVLSWVIAPFAGTVVMPDWGAAACAGIASAGSRLPSTSTSMPRSRIFSTKS